MKKIDKRKTYYIVLDTETCNTLTDENGKQDLTQSLAYDIGFQVLDKSGKVYNQQSYCVREIFEGEKSLMQSCYFAKKLPQYYIDLQNGTRQLATILTIRQNLYNIMKRYNIKIVVAYNARFDDTALKNTIRYITKSRTRYFFPYDTIIWDSLKMVNDTIAKQKNYKEFCEKNNYMTRHKKPQPRQTAEIVYRFITGNNDFIEKHTGLEDVKIESVIFVECMKKHKKMRKELYGCKAV